MDAHTTLLDDFTYSYSDPENLIVGDSLQQEVFGSNGQDGLMLPMLDESSQDTGFGLNKRRLFTNHGIDPSQLSSEDPMAPAFFSSDPFARRRSQSQPPPLDHLESPVSPHSLPEAQMAAQPSLVRAINYRKRGQGAKRPKVSRKAKTAQPQLSIQTGEELRCREDRKTISSSGPRFSREEQYFFNLYHDQTSLALGMQAKLHDFQQSIQQMQAFLRQAFYTGDCGPDHEKRIKIESKRLEARKTNRSIRDLGDFLEPLPMQGHDIMGPTLPQTAADIRGLEHGSIDGLLNSYGLPFERHMFLCEKKAVYLRFIGANRALMHKVLD